MDTPITHKNHRGEVFYLHFKPARRGKPSAYFFSTQITTDAVYRMPDGFYVDEREDGALSLVEKENQNANTN